MIYNLYTLWNMYLCMRTIHGIYVTYTFFRWLSEGTMGTMLWLLTFVYNPYEQKQILDKEKDKIILLDDYQTEDPNKYLN